MAEEKTNGWSSQTTYEYQLRVGPRTVLQDGDPVSVKGCPGRFKFARVGHPVDKRRSDWVDVWHETTGNLRSFSVKRIRKGRAK